MGYITSYYGDISLSRTVWDESRPWLPHRCIFTGKWIMPFTQSVRNRPLGVDGRPGVLMYGDYTAKWTTSKEFIVQKLKGNTG